MSKKEFLESLEWNGFDTYPPQGKSIYLSCKMISYNAQESVWRFLKINAFNAIYFDLDGVKLRFHLNAKWEFSWLPADEVDAGYEVYCENLESDQSSVSN